MVVDSKISMLLKSPYGFGKTIAACSVAVEGPIFLAYFDKKQPVEVLSFYKRYRPELLDNIEYEVYGAANANEYLMKLMKLRDDCRYVAVITDSATQLTSAAVNWSMGFRDPKGGKKDKISKDSPQLIPDFDEYKVETSLVTQALDISRNLPCHIIWTCHPLPSLKVEGSGTSIKVSTVKNIVTYGNKVGAIIPGNFTEIYHFVMENTWDGVTGKYSTRRKVSTVGIGDDFAKTALNLPAEFDITDKLFWEEWKKARLSEEAKLNDLTINQSSPPQTETFTPAIDTFTKWKT